MSQKFHHQGECDRQKNLEEMPRVGVWHMKDARLGHSRNNESAIPNMYKGWFGGEKWREEKLSFNLNEIKITPFSRPMLY